MEVLNELIKTTPAHTEESEAAVLDIFNKLKPRYKKQCTFHTSLPFSTYYSLSINCDKHCFVFPPQSETTIQTEDEC